MKRSRPTSPSNQGSKNGTERSGRQADVPAAHSATRPEHELSRGRIAIATIVVALVIFSGGIAHQSATGGSREAFPGSPSPMTSATFVGSETCAGCHATEAELWENSQHKLAMDHATETSVLGNFDDASFDYNGVHSRFFRRDGKFMVETDGPDGQPGEFEVKYTFGVDPLQQYLVEFPGGRVQALSLAWDTRSKEKGGQRWFHLYPNERIVHSDFLHWTKLNQNWNFMCAECHSTGVQKNYNAANDRFATTSAEISVGCETCHGQGSAHVAWAQEQQGRMPLAKPDEPTKGLVVRFDEPRLPRTLDPGTGNAVPMPAPPALRKEVETCGLCHARRGTLAEGWVPGRWLSDTHRVSLLTRGLYFPDGQMLDEVFNYGSFKQSKMFAAGVTCSDCHEPHGATLQIPGDGVCLQCHSSDKYAVANHHRHEGANPPLACASCHMPTHTYMVVDQRHDHSFRIPRPDLSATLGTPNACNDCHRDKSPEWAASAVERWYGPHRKGFQAYGEAFHAAWTGRADAGTLLASVAGDRTVPGFVRASALTELASYVSPANVELARQGLADPDPLVRISALSMLENVPPSQTWSLVAPLLSDGVRGVRIRAAWLLASVPDGLQPPDDREAFARAAAEFVGAQRLNGDRPEARSELGMFYARRGAFAAAEVEYRAALRLSPQFAPAATNLADLYRQLGRDSDGERILRSAIVASPSDAGLRHTLGLTLIRLKRIDEALSEFERAAQLAPDQARYSYVYAVALHSVGRTVEAMSKVDENLKRHPQDRDSLMAAITFNQDAGDFRRALQYAERLAVIVQNDPSLLALVEDLRRRVQ